ncbi:MAG TPA: serine/threonine-protein kinase [Pyrinomonadaceae bacterium]|nr:serine/threonine-protein kinase [Pyrinomonadaceae bacterium]
MKICSVCNRCFEDSVGDCPDHGELREGPNSVDIVPGYLIERIIEASPNAVIYKALQVEYGQECVISISDSNAFLSDAKIAAGLFNAGIAGVIESGELSNGSGFAVFEGSDGASLRDVLNDSPISLLDRIQIARQTAEAVHAVHSAGLTHGNIRPENVSISGLGTDELAVKIHNIDLGSAFAEGVLSNRFAMDSALGLLRYLAPERFRNEPATVQTDVYSLGLLLYEILCGHPPFEGNSAAALADMHLNQKPPEIKIENFDLRMLLTHTITEALQKQPSFRQSTADLFARQMRHIEQLATHVPTPPPVVAVAVASASSSVTRPVVTPVHREIEEPLPIAVVSVVDASPAPALSIRPTELPEIQLATAPIAPLPTAAIQTIEPPDGPTAAVPIETPLPFVPSITKRSRLKGMKQRLHSQISDARAALNGGPTLIDWQQPDDDIPSMNAVREELANTGRNVLFDADDEITHVRPPIDRIEISWDEPDGIALTADRRSSETGPSFLRHQPYRFDLGKVPIYAIALCAFLIVGFGLFSLGSVMADESEGYIGEAKRTPIQIPAQPVQAKPVEPQVTADSISAGQIELPEAIVQQPENPVGVKAKQAETVKTKLEVSKNRDPEPAKIEAVPVKKTIKAETAIVPSTLIISRGTGKPKAIVVSNAPPFGSEKLATEMRKREGSTRPRIVVIPRR